MLLFSFSKEVKKALLICEEAENIKELRDLTKNSKWLIVSGADQAELRELFRKRKLDSYFDAGIFGSPDDKNQILKNEMYKRNIVGKSLFIGDSIYDYQAAKNADIDFVFLSKWTDVSDWNRKFSNISVFLDLAELSEQCIQ